MYYGLERIPWSKAKIGAINYLSGKLQQRLVRLALLSLWLWPLVGCVKYSAPALQTHQSHYGSLEGSPPCAQLLELERHSSYSMYLLATCFERGWLHQPADYEKAKTAFTRSARCGDPRALRWLEQHGVKTKYKNYTFVMVRQAKRSDGQFDVEGIVPAAGRECNLDKQLTAAGYVARAILPIIEVAMIPLCPFSNAGCPIFESNDEKETFTGTLMGPFPP